LKTSNEKPLFKPYVYFCFTLIFLVLIVFALSDRISSVYLEDDMLWFLPSLSQLTGQQSFLGSIMAFHKGELTFSDGVYFSILFSIFGLQLKYYVWVSVAIHFVNAILLFFLLKNRLKISFDASFLASFLYLGFYGHFHAYTWPLASHHLIVVFFILLITFFYLKTEELFERNSDCKKYYWITLGLSFAASFLRLSILIVPVIILIHLLFATKDKEKVLAKYDRWLPLFGIFMVYQLLVFSYGSPGDVLSGAVKPFYEILGEKRSLLKGAGVVLVFMAGLFAVGFFLRRILAKRTSNVFIPIVGWGSLLIVLIPQIAFLCLHTFITPISSALGAPAWQRWQVIAFPDPSPLTIVGMGFGVVMMLSFLHYMRTRNRSLIIFVVLYAALFPYLSRYLDGIPSRYLIYPAVSFCVILSLFLMEILPNYFPQALEKICRKGCCLFLLLFLAGNVFSIKIRLLRTTLVDYHWSYDYIKIANLIKQDLSKDPTRANLPLCILGLKDIPYAQNWKESFLKGFDFQRHDPFVQTFLAAVLKPDGPLKNPPLFPNKNPEMIVNAVCPRPGLVYRVDGVTVRDENGKTIEPFYQFLEAGLENLRRADDARAAALLEEALKAKPFFINFVRGSSKRGPHFYEEAVSSALADTIYQKYACFYDGDPKIEYINNMIQTEAQDYARALAVVSYLKYKGRYTLESQALLKKAFVFVSKEELLEMNPFPTPSADSFRTGFAHFITQAPAHLVSDTYRPVGEIVENYRGFHLIWFNDFYFAWPKDAGDFNLAKFRLRKKLTPLVSATKHQLRKIIDQAWIDVQTPRQTQEMPSVKEETVYKSFRIFKAQDEYVCLSEKEGPKTLFKTRSLSEAKLVVDHFLSM